MTYILMIINFWLRGRERGTVWWSKAFFIFVKRTSLKIWPFSASFPFFYSNSFLTKSGIRTQIIRFEGQQTDHLTTTMTQNDIVWTLQVLFHFAPIWYCIKTVQSYCVISFQDCGTVVRAAANIQRPLVQILSSGKIENDDFFQLMKARSQIFCHFKAVK